MGIAIKSCNFLSMFIRFFDENFLSNFFENFRNELCKQNFMLAKKPVEEIFANSHKDVIEKVQQTTARLDKNGVNAEILFVFHESKILDYFFI